MLVGAGGTVLDQFTKALMVERLPLGQVQPVLPGLLQWRRVENTGAAFSLFHGGVVWLGLISLLVSLGLVLWLLNRPPRRRLNAVAYGLVLAGALGNGLDRWFRGAVVDWIELVPVTFPVFNLADVAINVAVALLLLDALVQSRRS
ncbi:MAG: signal peptidase II [Synechococcus sp. SB0668_bin_15]|nr:signal peptidase II [Synechococcus sp. SB0668_bin_15]MXZ82725.1 signal peptidase II [Synechococcus sp. SB0666_bin_14]MYC49842.1 signal peptidase II [Synechococcus sp. SB0662_bin_14]MYG47448.1 signal peptidase II [Synechococcus sp. SB0675_bin_6]MYJ60294.1 signal peptidase II [Synechococcus sp. SB0672_bin_6]MYK91721.1 signal peptidase II [Synechococcus sp. SB0669_bin_8]